MEDRELREHFDAIGSQFALIGKRFDGVDEQLNVRLGKIDEQLGGLATDIENLAAITAQNFGRLEEKMDAGFAHCDSEFERLEEKMDTGFLRCENEFERLEEKMDTGFAKLESDIESLASITAESFERLEDMA